VALVGRSGAGKTTLVNLLLALIATEAGLVSEPAAVAPRPRTARTCSRSAKKSGHLRVILPTAKRTYRLVWSRLCNGASRVKCETAVAGSVGVHPRVYHEMADP
jgi:energy-coupling factor transporter ATP-binding protein EcfA2